MVCLKVGFFVSEVFCPLRGVSIFPKDFQEIHSLALVPFGHTCFLDKRPYFLWCASKNTSSSWVLIFGVKRKEAHMSQVKTKQKTKEVRDGD
ncbi:MAG: hypothetical protein COX96_00705 [Candidatus Omnitrophica bacterium CG_4_10_14_0_2_um_filter_44_9]|nr:MAG: hypothetical protein COX96_00705 [Candidatus Omnitrophica bacterium CG_4_10_14_0_2_um_filter_44_9]